MTDREKAYEVLVEKLDHIVAYEARIAIQDGPASALRALRSGGAIYEQVRTLVSIHLKKE